MEVTGEIGTAVGAAGPTEALVASQKRPLQDVEDTGDGSLPNADPSLEPSAKRQKKRQKVSTPPLLGTQINEDGVEGTDGAESDKEEAAAPNTLDSGDEMPKGASETSDLDLDTTSEAPAVPESSVMPGKQKNKGASTAASSVSLPDDMSRQHRAHGAYWMLPLNDALPQLEDKKGAAESWVRMWCLAFVKENLGQKDIIDGKCADTLITAQLRSLLPSHFMCSPKEQERVRTKFKRTFNKMRREGQFAEMLSEATRVVQTELQDQEGANGEQADLSADVETAPAQPGPQNEDSIIEPPFPNGLQEHAPTASEWASLLESEDASETDPQPNHGPDAGKDVDDAAAPGGAARHEDEQFPTRNPRPGRTRMLVDEEESLRQLEKYFPGAPGVSDFCTICASYGHGALQCPQTICRWCSGDHFSWSCASRLRCSKCQQMGHDRSACTEKLAMADGDEFECAFCGSDHHEYECDQIWRSYRPRPQDIKTVRSIPTFCGYCGSEEHYVSECGQRGGRTTSSTWSIRNRDLYVDPNSTEEAIVTLAPSSAPVDGEPGLRIKGVGAKKTHIFFSESEDSDDAVFIGEKPVQPREARGRIQMASNIQFAPVGATRPPPSAPASHLQHPLPAQPPLPPGPPPPSRPSGGGGYSALGTRARNNGPQPPVHPLPPRPTGVAHFQGASDPTPASGYQGGKFAKNNNNKRRGGPAPQQAGNQQKPRKHRKPRSGGKAA